MEDFSEREFIVGGGGSLKGRCVHAASSVFFGSMGRCNNGGDEVMRDTTNNNEDEMWLVPGLDGPATVLSLLHLQCRNSDTEGRSDGLNAEGVSRACPSIFSDHTR